MGELFSGILDMSITASIFVLLVICIKILMKYIFPRAPRFLQVLLWVMVAFRLVCPFSIQTELSVLPYFVTQHQAVESFLNGYVEETELLTSGTAEYDAAIAAGRESVSIGAESDQIVVVKDSLDAPTTVKEKYFPLLAKIWLCGVGAMLVYAVIRYLCLRGKVAGAQKMQILGRFYQSDRISTPLLLGIFFPRCYLPYRMNEEQRAYQIAQTKAHLDRKDLLIKQFSYLLLCLHWFNPFAWVAYLLLCRDLTVSADQKVVRDYSTKQKERTAEMMCAVQVSNDPVGIKNMYIGICPFAIREKGSAKRARMIASHRHMTTGAVLLLSMLMLVSFVFLLTDKPTVTPTLMGADYGFEKPIYRQMHYDPTDSRSDTWDAVLYRYRITADYCLYQRPFDQEEWECVGSLEKDTLDNERLQGYLSEKVSLWRITDCYRLTLQDGGFYLAFQTVNGKTYLGYGIDDAKLIWLYEMEGQVEEDNRISFLEASLTDQIANGVEVLQIESDKQNPGYEIVCFMAEEDMGFAVFEKTKNGYRYLNHHLYEGAAVTQNGVYFCEHSAVCDGDGIAKPDNSYDVVLITDPEASSVKRIYQADGKEEKVITDYPLTSPGMSLLLQSEGEGYDTALTYCYRQDGVVLGIYPDIRVKATMWFDDYSVNGEQSVQRREIQLEEYPDVTFVWTRNELQAVEKDGSIRTLYCGAPIYNVYFADFNQDGCAEFCSVVEDPSGKNGQLLRIYHYQTNATHIESASDYDYRLYLYDDCLAVELLPKRYGFFREQYYLTYINNRIERIKFQ